MSGPSAADDLQQMYDTAPVSLWIEDFSAIKDLLVGLRNIGIDDIAEQMAVDPGLVDRLISLIRVIDVNRATLELFKATSKEQLLARMDEVLRGDMRQSFRHEVVSMWDGDVSVEIESVNYALDGTPVDVLLRRRVLPGHEETWDRVMISMIDISERKRAEREVMAARDYASGLFEHSPVSLWLEDYSELHLALEAMRADGVVDLAANLAEHPGTTTRLMRLIRLVDVNNRTLELYRAPNKQALLSRLDDVFGASVEEHFAAELIGMWNGDLRHERESVNYTLAGEAIDIHLEWSVLPGHEHTWSRVLVSIADITARRRAEAYMQYLGTHDSLTGLHNRAVYDDAMMRHLWHTRPVSIVIADLDGLKQANDRLGHAVGDTLLRRAAEALRAAAHSDDIVARIGGDEFAVLMPDKDELAAAELLKRIVKVVDVNNQFYQGPRLSMSIGAATAQPGDDLRDAHRLADQRMYADKAEHRRPAVA